MTTDGCDPVNRELGQLNPGIRALDVSRFLQSGRKILVGTRGSDVFEVDHNSILINVIVQGHSKDTGKCATKAEVWGLSCHPTENKFVTCGSDRTVRIWNKNELLQMSEQFDIDITAVDFANHPVNFLAVGNREGRAFLLNIETLVPTTGHIMVKNHLLNNPWIRSIRVSPDNSMVAIGAHAGRAWVDLGRVD